MMCMLLAACTYEPALLECGDLVCPPHTTCLGDRCVTPAQLESCVDKAADEPCAVDARVGVCVGGACTYVGCGNGVIDPGEVCDDSNTNFGDGCAGDCRSQETCGNGITDFAAGETCDCGADEATRPEQCSAPNSDDAANECSPSCELRFCGDDVVNTLEQCDGELIAGGSCAQFGYYHGEPTCTPGCLLEPTGCYGRCGDLDIEPAFGEFCDGTAPVGSCVNYGFDAGLPACSPACSPDFTDCERFGWSSLETRSTIAVERMAGATIVLGAVPDGGTNAWAVINSVRIFAPEGDYTALVNDGGRVIAVSRGHLAVWTGTAWQVAGVGWPSTTSAPSAAWASAERGLWVAIDGVLWHYGTAWTQQTLTNIIGVSGSGDTVFAWSATAAWSSTANAAFTSELLPALGAATLQLVLRSATGPHWVVAKNGSVTTLYAYKSSTWSSQSVAVRDAILGENGTLLVAAQNGIYVVSAPVSSISVAGGQNSFGITRTPDGGIASAGPGGALGLRIPGWIDLDMIFAGYAYPPYEDDRFGWLDIASDGQAVTGANANYAIWLGAINPSGSYFSPNDLPGVYADDVSVLPGGTVVLGVNFGAQLSSGDTLWDPNYYDTDGNYIGYFPVSRLDATQTGAVLALGEQIIVRITATTVEPIIVPDVTFYGAQEASDGTIIALGYGPFHHIYRISPSREIEIIATTNGLSDVWVTPDGDAIAGGGPNVFRCLRASSTCTSETVGLSVYSVVATSLDDVLVGGAGASGVFGTLSHWDGSRWSAVRTPSSAIYEMVISGNTIAYVDGGRNMRTLTRSLPW